MNLETTPLNTSSSFSKGSSEAHTAILIRSF